MNHSVPATWGHRLGTAHWELWTLCSRLQSPEAEPWVPMLSGQWRSVSWSSRLQWKRINLEIGIKVKAKLEKQASGWIQWTSKALTMSGPCCSCSCQEGMLLLLWKPGCGLLFPKWASHWFKACTICVLCKPTSFYFLPKCLFQKNNQCRQACRLAEQQVLIFNF